jgi:CubicO group peptidase (beta-lactamase class C family)
VSTLTELRLRIAEILAEYQTPGAAVGILRGGEITELAFGVKDITTGEPVSTETVFQAGSLTKSWTALAFLQFVDEGTVGLDEPVRRYLPGFRVADPEASALVTPRHLLQHTSGIEEAYGDPGEGEDVYARMVAAIVDAPQVSPLGSVHGYSAALGYAILARIMEVIDAKPWHVIMTDRVFAPMGLTGTDAGGRTSTRRGRLEATCSAHATKDRSPPRWTTSPARSAPAAPSPRPPVTCSLSPMST